MVKTEYRVTSAQIHNCGAVQYGTSSARSPIGWTHHIVPRPSPFTIVLTGDEQNELETRARRYTAPYRDVIRAKIVLLAAQGLSNDVIAARLDTPRQIVSKWRKRFALARLQGLEEQPRCGRPAPFSS